MTRPLRAAAIVTAISVAFISSCSSDVTSTETGVVETTTFASSLGVDLAASTRTTNGEYIRDISVGTGPLVASGDSVNVRYTGWLSNASQFDSNQAAGYGFKLGAGKVIAGWEEGIPGMRVGGKRQLVIPSSLGYGPYGNGPIPGNAVLVFNVEIVSKF